MSTPDQTTFLDVFALELPNGMLPNEFLQDYESRLDSPSLVHSKECSSPLTGSSSGSKMNSDFVFPSSHHLSHEFNNYSSNGPLKITELQLQYPASSSSNGQRGPYSPTYFTAMSSYDQFFPQYAAPQHEYLPPLPKYNQGLDRRAPGPHQSSQNPQVAPKPKPAKKFLDDTQGLVLPCTEPGCEKVFNRHFNLKSHLKSHATERNYMCDSCPASFRRSHDLKRHTRSLHTTVKPFECVGCRKRFARMDALKRHASRVGSGCYQPRFVGSVSARDYEDNEEGYFGNE